MNHKSLSPIALTLTVVASGALAGWAILFGAGDSQGQPAVDPDTAQALTPTPVAPIPAGNDINAARAKAAEMNQTVPKLIAAVEGGRLADVLALYPYQERLCTPANARIGNTPGCAESGLKDGDRVRVFPVDIGEVAYAGLKYMEQNLGERLLSGRPRLALIARKQTGEFYVSFVVDPSASGVDTLNFLVSSGATEGVVSYYGGVKTYTLFDRFRDEERADPKTKYTILGASQEALDREATKHELRSAGNKGP